MGVKIGIIGAGMSGMLMAIKLLKSGRDNIVIFERAEKVGGTWRENRYPGVACDVASFAYCYDFEYKHDWSRRFSPGPEIQKYFESVAQKHQLESLIRFNTEVVEAKYENLKWQVKTQTGDSDTFDILVDATGPLNCKKYPDIDGMENFTGEMFHTADWNDDYDYQGKKIALIGSGSSGVQATAPLAEAASALTLFIRTPQWVMGTPNPEYGPLAKALKKRFPAIGKMTRAFYLWVGDLFGRAALEQGLKRKFVTKACEMNLNTLKCPELKAKMQPDFEPMCRRMIVSDTYYPALQKSHVQVERQGISHIEEKGVVTKDGKLHEADLIVLATGFTPNVWGVKNIIGVNGKTMRDVWQDEMRRNYRSIAMPGFPNYFVLIGPNSPITNLSLIEIADIGVEFVLRCVEKIEAGELKSLMPSEAAALDFGQALSQSFDDTVWVTGCGGWYTDGSQLPQTWPWLPSKFREDLAMPDMQHFEINH